MHAQRLRVDFDDDDVNVEQQIEILTADITKVSRAFASADRLFVCLTVAFGSCSDRHKALRCV